MRRIIMAFAAVILAGCCNSEYFQKADNYGSIDSAALEYLQDMRDMGGTNEVNSIMVIKDGKKLMEYYDCCYGPEFKNICWSASKTFTATAVGFAVQDGLLKIDSKVVDVLDKDVLPEHISDTLASLTVYDLLRMASGLKLDPIGPTGSLKLKNPTQKVLAGGFKFVPGEKFSYNSHNTYLLSVLVTKVTGKTVADYLNDKLFKPLGISDWHWDTSAEGYTMGGWGLYLRTEDLAKMGQFFLNKGEWEGKQLLNPEWIQQATSAQIYQQGDPVPGDEWAMGYGYQMWIESNACSRIDGAYGQFVHICPEKNAVIVITQHVNNTAASVKAMWERIYSRI